MDRTRVIYIRVTPDEFDLISSAANASGADRTNWSRIRLISDAKAVHLAAHRALTMLTKASETKGEP